MSDTNVLTQYEITGNLGDDPVTIMLLAPAMTDAAALAIAEALRTVQLPAGMTRGISIFKSVQTSVTTTATLTDATPVFA